MKIIKVNTFDSFRKLESLYNRDTNYFRGQSDYSWDITPGLARNRSIKGIDDLLEIECKLINKFKEKIEQNKQDRLIKLVSGGYHNSWKVLMAAQHYGLPTRLLDFSNNIFSALQFAVGDLQYLNKDGALIVYENVNNIHENVDSPVLKREFSNAHEDFFFQVPIYAKGIDNEQYLSERRKRIQGSKFLYRESTSIYQCLSSNKRHRVNLKIIHIPNKLKPAIIDYLINDQKLAPDLYAGRNCIDYYAGILKGEFSKLNDNSLEDYFKN